MQCPSLRHTDNIPLTLCAIVSPASSPVLGRERQARTTFSPPQGSGEHVGNSLFAGVELAMGQPTQERRSSSFFCLSCPRARHRVGLEGTFHLVFSHAIPSGITQPGQYSHYSLFSILPVSGQPTLLCSRVSTAQQLSTQVPALRHSQNDHILFLAIIYQA